MKETLLGDALLVAVKLRSSRVLSIRVQLRAQAAIIRQYAEGIYVGLNTLQHPGGLPEEYFHLVRNEINAFRLEFREWAASFRDDGYEDDWGLF